MAHPEEPTFVHVFLLGPHAVGGRANLRESPASNALTSALTRTKSVRSPQDALVQRGPVHSHKASRQPSQGPIRSPGFLGRSVSPARGRRAAGERS